MNTKKIFDFDGFITNESLEARPFVEKFLELYQKETGLNQDDMDFLLELGMAKILTDPASGWNVGGKIVAPATSSEYVFYTVVLQTLYSKASDASLPKEFAELAPAIIRVDGNKMQEIYQESYKSSATVFRDGARDFLNKHIDAAIVTNSNPAKVDEKLRTIGLGDGKIRLYGNAKKFLVTPEAIPGVPETLSNTLLPRPVYLWRGNYKKVLDEICQGTRGTTCGDVWELDNALPGALGYRTITIDNTFNGEIIGMTDYEKKMIPKLSNSYVVKSLEEADKILSEKF